MDAEEADFNLELEADIQHTDSYSELEHLDSSVKHFCISTVMMTTLLLPLLPRHLPVLPWHQPYLLPVASDYQGQLSKC